MATLNFPTSAWDKEGEKRYKVGTQNGLVFVWNPNKATPGYGAGVVWNGLTEVQESPEGAEATAIYADNRKYLNLRSAEDFKGSITAYDAPDEFLPCMGIETVNGVNLTGQAHQKFCFYYRTEIGTDLAAAEADSNNYEIHVVYNATVGAVEQTRSTINEDVEPTEFSWEFETVPVQVSGANDTAHIIIGPDEITQDLLDAMFGEIGSNGAWTAPTAPLMPEDIMVLTVSGSEEDPEDPEEPVGP